MKPNGGGRVILCKDGSQRNGGSGLLHPTNPDKCFKCPQYGQKIIYARKCYYSPQCVWPVWFQVWRLNRILKKRGIKDES